MLDDMDANMANLINKQKDSLGKEVEIKKQDNIRDKEEIKYLKRKLLMPGHGHFEGSNSSDFNNTNFNQIVKEKTGESSLYESIIIHIKTLNIRYLLEIFELNLQREEEVRNILNEKNKGKNVINKE